MSSTMQHDGDWPYHHQLPDEPNKLGYSEAYYAEVLDPKSKVINEGQTGELVLTTLGLWGPPALHWRLVCPRFMVKNSS